MHSFQSQIRRVAASLIVALPIAFLPAQAAQVEIAGPTGSGWFGTGVFVLPNGNFVVADSLRDHDGVADVGAVYLFSPSGELISTLRGSRANDRVGTGVHPLWNGNVVVTSPNWNGEAGAVTLISAQSGLEGVVSATNSLVGGSARMRVGSGGITALWNGNFVVKSPQWYFDNIHVQTGAYTFGSGVDGVTGIVSSANSLVGDQFRDNDSAEVIALSNGNYVVSMPRWRSGRGAATFGSGTQGVSGTISPANSLVGESPASAVGAVTALANGNYVVSSPGWANDQGINVGAVTFASGTSGLTGLVTAGNSLIGAQAGDAVGRVIPLEDGNYVVASMRWRNGDAPEAGAVTFASGVTGRTGVVSPANSLVGTTAGDRVGYSEAGVITELGNGNYVVNSPYWDHGALVDVGAATFVSGAAGFVGTVSSANSLIGSTANDRVAAYGTRALTNGNYVVRSPNWTHGTAVDAGAVTFGSGVFGVVGTVSPSNSLVGSSAGDFVGWSLTALATGNYVASSIFWDNGTATDAGAATFGSGTAGVVGPVSGSNSLVGSSAIDRVGVVTALTNGNYVVNGWTWDRGSIVNAGAVTFASGTTGISGPVSPANSLVGANAHDGIGYSGVFALADGNYVVRSPSWTDAAGNRVGAYTVASGFTGLTGEVSPANSLVGSTAGDLSTSRPFVASFANGAVILEAPKWDNGGTINAGAVLLGRGDGSLTGPVSSAHGVLGTVTGPDLGNGNEATHDARYDIERNQLIVGMPSENRVVLYRPGTFTELELLDETPDPSQIGQAVTFTAVLTASPLPSDGQVRFVADGGESCVDATPIAMSATRASYSCEIVFARAGTSMVAAEYLGSTVHAYSGSQRKPHATIDSIFANGFEATP